MQHNAAICIPKIFVNDAGGKSYLTAWCAPKKGSVTRPSFQFPPVFSFRAGSTSQSPLLSSSFQFQAPRSPFHERFAELDSEKGPVERIGRPRISVLTSDSSKLNSPAK